jgi:phage-related protein (TIGR01555 family)
MSLMVKSKVLDSRGRNVRLRVVNDAWENPYTGHRTARDKLSQSRAQSVDPSTDRQTYEDIYHGDDLGARIVDELVEDMVRKWIRLGVTMRDDADAAENVDAANDMLGALDELDAKAAVTEALQWARVFGGSLIFVGADDGGGGNLDSMAEPLRENAIRDIKFLEVYDRWDVDIASEYTDPLNPKFGQPETYRVQNQGLTRGLTERSDFLIHETRTIRFDGVRVNKRRKLRNNGWHDSAYIRIQAILSEFSISWSSAAQLLADFAPMIFKSPGLDMALAQDGGNVVLDRMQQLDIYRSTVRMMPIDEGEELARQVTPVTGMDGLLAAFILRLCAAARMPVTKLFGQSPAGLNSTAEGDLSFWYDRVEAHQSSDLKKPLKRLIQLLWLCKTGPTGGVEPRSWDLEFEKLWQMSQLEEAQARKAQSETDNNYIDSGVLMPGEVSQSRFGGDRYSFETQLDDEAREAEEPEPEPEPEQMMMPFPAASNQLPAGQLPVGATQTMVGGPEE